MGEECQETKFIGMKEHTQPFMAHLAVGSQVHPKESTENLKQGIAMLKMGQRRLAHKS